MKSICNGKRYISTNMADSKKIVLIGAGNVATHLGLSLQQKGCEVVQVYSRTSESASLLADMLGVPYATSLAEVVCDADIYIVALKDAVFQELLPVIIKGREKALFVHTAGSLPMSLWEGTVSRYGVLYPMQTFSKQRAVNFEEVSFFVEASGVEELDTLKGLAGLLSPRVYEANSEQRKYLHLSAVFACNFTNHMYALSAHLLKRQHLPFEAMLPLIDETCRKVHELLPQDAQTGPAVRGDHNVMSNHLDLLCDEPEIKELYEKISESISRMNKV